MWTSIAEARIIRTVTHRVRFYSWDQRQWDPIQKHKNQTTIKQTIISIKEKRCIAC